jgi:hypothetical protein
VTLDQLIAKLRRDRFEIDAPEHTDADRAYRRGWNARTNALIQLLEHERTEQGLRELAACDVDAPTPVATLLPGPGEGA